MVPRVEVPVRSSQPEAAWGKPMALSFQILPVSFRNEYQKNSPARSPPSISVGQPWDTRRPAGSEGRTRIR